MVRRVPVVLLAALVVSGTGLAGETPAHWRAEGRRELSRTMAALRSVDWSHARNVILFVGDGMSMTTVDAARILAGQLEGRPGEEHELSFERFPFVALARTYNTNQQTPDSAGTMTALATGVKTRAGMLAVDGQLLRRQFSRTAEHALPTILELAEDRGLATGIVTTTRVTHATPAALYAHTPERAWERDGDLPPAAREAGMADIARQLVENPHGDGIDVVLGGGRCWFVPAGTEGPAAEGCARLRTDGRDLLEAWRSRTGGAVVFDAKAFRAVDPATTRALFGLFAPSHLQYEHDRKRDPRGEPSLTEMTEAAIRILSRDPDGFFLMVEAGRIDHAHHAANAYRALTDTIELSRAVARARELVDPKRTLIIVTADHGHPLTIAGYATRGAPILGLVRSNDGRGLPRRSPSPDRHGRPYTILGYQTGPVRFAERPNLEQKHVMAPDYRQESAIPLPHETHGGEDVPIYAVGPHAQLFQRTVEQTYVFHVMLEAWGWGASDGPVVPKRPPRSPRR